MTLFWLHPLKTPKIYFPRGVYNSQNKESIKKTIMYFWKFTTMRFNLRVVLASVKRIYISDVPRWCNKEKHDMQNVAGRFMTTESTRRSWYVQLRRNPSQKTIIHELLHGLLFIGRSKKCLNPEELVVEMATPQFTRTLNAKKAIIDKRLKYLPDFWKGNEGW